MANKLKVKIKLLKNKYNEVLKKLKNMEFHFVDIYNSKEITSDCKLNIFRDFTDLICQNYVPLFAQSYQNDCSISLRLNNRQFKNPDEVIAMILLFKQVTDVMIKKISKCICNDR